MGILGRVSGMIKAKANSSLDELENPLELLDQKLRDMDTQLNSAKISSAQVLGNQYAIEKQLTSAKHERDEYDNKVKLALSKGNEDLAKRAIAKKLDADKKVSSLETSYNTSKSQAESLKSNLRKLENEIESTRRYRDEAAARYTTATAAEEVNSILADVKSKFDSGASIKDIERRISKKESKAAGLAELKDLDNFESEFEDLNKLDIDSELEKYKNSL